VELVTDPAEMTAIAAAISQAPLVAFDLEFVSADRLVPGLCLVQVAWLGEDVSLDAPAAQIVAAEPQVRLIDPIAVDVAPVIAALAAHPLVIAHAPRQDLGLLATRFGTTMPGIIDTQLMAACCGIGEQVGLAALGNELLRLSMSKDHQWTDWARRPLSEAQLTYAEADVRYLPALYAKLAEQLDQLSGQRLAWVREESRAILADAIAASAVTPETAWEHVGGARGLDAPAQAALIALAAWRQRLAAELDRPLGQVLADKALVELAKSRPGNAGGVRALKGISPIAKTHADAIVAALAGAKPAAGTAKQPWRAASSRSQRWAEILVAIVHLIAEETGIASRLLATRSDAEELARVVDEKGMAAADALPAFSTWRREVIGAAWRGWLEGTLAIVGDAAAPHGIRLVPRGV
jgi:ribonuclease D